MGVRADLEVAAVLALVHVGVHVADDRELDLAAVVSAKSGTGPTLIIWWTAGVSGIEAPAIRAIRGLHTPQAMTTVSACDRRRASVRTRGDPAVDDVDPGRPRSSAPDGQRAELLGAPRA